MGKLKWEASTPYGSTRMPCLEAEKAGHVVRICRKALGEWRYTIDGRQFVVIGIVEEAVAKKAAGEALAQVLKPRRKRAGGPAVGTGGEPKASRPPPFRPAPLSGADDGVDIRSFPLSPSSPLRGERGELGVVHRPDGSVELAPLAHLSELSDHGEM